MLGGALESDCSGQSFNFSNLGCRADNIVEHGQHQNTKILSADNPHIFFN